MKNRKRLILILSISAICFASYFFIQTSGTNPSQSRPSFTPEVDVIIVKKQKIDIYKELPARISAYKISHVRPQANGIIKERLFEEGSFVKEGQTLYQIDSSIYKADYKNAHALLKATGIKKLRYQELRKIDAVSKQEYDNAVADFTRARAEVEKANINLDYTKIYAPISGFISKSNVTAGALVSADQSQILATITQLDPIFADIALPSTNLAEFRNYNDIPASIIVNGTEYENNGIVKFSEMLVDQSSDSVNLRVTFTNKNQKLLPGMFVNVRLHLNSSTAITVPQRATTRDPNGNLIIWTVSEDGTAHSKMITADKTYKENWIVTSGLTQGEMIIYQGFQKITPGMKVNPINSER